MSDMIDLYRDLRADKQSRRAEEQARIAATVPGRIEHLQAAGHVVRRLSVHGPHLRIDECIDYWPSSERMMRVRGCKAQQHVYDRAVAAVKAARRANPLPRPTETAA